MIKNRARHGVIASLVLQQTLLSVLIYEDSAPSVCFVIFPKFQFSTALHETEDIHKGTSSKGTSGNSNIDNLSSTAPYVEQDF